MTNKKPQKYFFVAIFIAGLAVTLLLLRPFLSIIMASGAIAIIFHPLQKSIQKIVKRKTATAFISLLLILIVILTPLFFFSWRILQEASALYFKLVNNDINEISQVALFLRGLAQKFFPQTDFQFDLQSLASPLLNSSIKKISGVFTSALHIFLSLTIGLIALYYFLKDGDEIKKKIFALSPLADKYDQGLFDTLKKTITATVRGSLLIAVIQGALTSVGFAIFGIPNAALWGSFAVLSALIPGLGTVLVIGPGVLYLLIIGSLPNALGLLVWGLVAVGLIDNLLGPKLIQKGTALHPLLILLAVLGGISLFGPVGFLVGPIIMSLFFALVKIYPDIISSS